MLSASNTHTAPFPYTILYVHMTIEKRSTRGQHHEDDGDDNYESKESDTDLRGNYALPLWASGKKEASNNMHYRKITLCDVERMYPLSLISRVCA